jgi:glycosyltransferase involved in cell wall biosynthesis
MAEGVPKVSQEAAACGLPVILFGFYEAPSVVDGENGYVVWSDEEMATRLEQLLSDKDLRTRLGARGAVMAREWNWDILALKWERKVLSVIENAH